MRTREDAAKSVIENAPISVQNTLSRAFSGAASPRSAIKATCLACVGFDRPSITNCTGFTCPLWMYRPFQSSEGK